jgi:D-Tyr-tRNAtyr deacylase
VPARSGVFGAHMLVEIQNDGPFTLILDQGPEG